jgi:ABC-type uncharacterized transport system substrate-binding protein
MVIRRRQLLATRSCHSLVLPGEKVIAAKLGGGGRHAVPTMYHFREFAEAGGLVSYGIDPADVYRQVGIYTGRVLKGDKPVKLPVMQAPSSSS